MFAYLALAALQVVGGFQQADITRKNGDLQNDIAEMNAKFADLDAFNARAQGQSNAARYDSTVNQTIAADKAAYAGAGVDVGYGTAKDIEADNKIAATNNVLQIKRQAENQAVGFQTQAINIRLGGHMTQLQSNLNAASEESAGIMKGISTGISGYAYGESTGKGVASKTGSDGKPTYDKMADVHIKESGDGIRAPATEYGNGYGWYPDAGKEGQPGFFGRGPRGSFTDEVG
jgi:hypothetical protein